MSPSPRLLFSGLVVSCTVLALAGCDCSGGGDVAAGGTCDDSSDCMAGLVCTAGHTCWTPPGGGPDGSVVDFDGPRPDVPTACGEFPFTVTSEPPDLILLVDRSLSMDDDIAGGGTKWEAMLAAVDSVTH